MFEGIVAECLNSSMANGTTKFGLCSRSFWFYWLIWWKRRNGNKIWHSENLSAVFANPQSSHCECFCHRPLSKTWLLEQRGNKDLPRSHSSEGTSLRFLMEHNSIAPFIQTCEYGSPPAMPLLPPSGQFSAQFVHSRPVSGNALRTQF